MNTNRTNRCKNRFHARGITLIETLIVISILVMIAWFALPSAGHATARAEMTAATEEIRYTVESARKLARMTESPVVLGISDEPGPAGQSISFHRARDGSSSIIQNYRLPDSVQLHADRATYTFDGRGLIEQPGRITLMSKQDEAITATVSVD